ncbi:MAG: chemotaxis protein CheW [Gammaproteobacteria bacterium]|nr:chemotaxis protein CheW [Gammaproteobacteria bacterium]
MADISPDFIPCVLIPLKLHYLILPNTTIAEVIPLPKLKSSDMSTPFWVGQYDWQDHTLPVIDLDSLIEDKPSACDDANKLCIVRGINTQAALNNYAFPCYGAAQLIHLTESALKVIDTPEQSDYIHCQLQIGNKIAYIPNLDAIEIVISKKK